MGAGHISTLAALGLAFSAIPSPAHARDQAVVECAIAAAPENMGATLYQSFALSVEKDTDFEPGDEFEAQIAEIMFACIEAGSLDPAQLEEDFLVLIFASLVGAQVKAEAGNRLEILGVETQALEEKFQPLIAQLPLKQAFLADVEPKHEFDRKFDAAFAEFIALHDLEVRKVEIPVKAYVLGLAMELAANDPD